MTSAQRRQREKEERRNDIINAAEILFFSKGYDNVSMDDIAKKVELNKATIYLYFNNKESLYYAIVLRGIGILSELVKERAAEGKTGVDRMWGVWRAYLEFANQHSDYFRAYVYFQSGRFGLDNMINLEIYGKPLHPTFGSSTVLNIPNGEYVKDILDLHYGIFETLCNSIKSGIEEATIRQDVNPAEAAAVLLMLVESTAKMNPVIRNELETQGIGQQKFLKDIHCYLDLTK